MRHPLHLLVLMVLTACGEGENPWSSCPPESEWDWPASLCASPKALLSCLGPPLTLPATCSAQLFESLSVIFNVRGYFLYKELLSPDFRFVDETTLTETAGRQREGTAVERVFKTFRAIYFGLYGDVREEADQGCMKVCGLVQMRLFLHSESGFIVNDETCLTACPNPADDLWYLTEWRIVRAVPPARIKEGFEVVTWAEVKRLSQEQGVGPVRQRLLCLFCALILAGCGEDSPVEPVSAPTSVPARSPSILLANLFRSLNEKDLDLYSGLFSPYFTFVDETTMTEEVGSERGIVYRVFQNHHDIAYRFLLQAETDAGHGCLVVCGFVLMRLLRDQGCENIKVIDETCLTLCPRIADGFWYLTEWADLEKCSPRAQGAWVRGENLGRSETHFRRNLAQQIAGVTAHRERDRIMTIRIVLEDDHEMLREGVKALFVAQDGIEVAGEGSRGESALEQAPLLKPDVVVMDISMPRVPQEGNRLGNERPGTPGRLRQRLFPEPISPL